MAHHIAAWLGIPAGIVIVSWSSCARKEWSCAPAAGRPGTSTGQQRPGSGQAAHKRPRASSDLSGGLSETSHMTGNCLRCAGRLLCGPLAGRSCYAGTSKRCPSVPSLTSSAFRTTDVPDLDLGVHDGPARPREAHALGRAKTFKTSLLTRTDGLPGKGGELAVGPASQSRRVVTSDCRSASLP